jgi:hypothetical protein
MSLDELIYSMLGVEKNVALVSDEKVFKISIDNSINNPIVPIKKKPIQPEKDIKTVEPTIDINAIQEEVPIVHVMDKPEQLVQDVKPQEDIKEIKNIKPEQQKLPKEIPDKKHFAYIDDLLPNIKDLKRLYQELHGTQLSRSSKEYINAYQKFEEIFFMLKCKSLRQLNVVLDIDNTLLYAIDTKSIDGIDLTKYDNLLHVKWFISGQQHKLTLACRKGLDLFFSELKDFSKFFINTHGLGGYAVCIAEALSNRYNITIQSDKIVSRDTYRGDTSAKSLDMHLTCKSEKDEFYKNSIALDDKPDVWAPDDTHCPVLNSKKYIHFHNILSNALEREVFPYSVMINTKNCNKLMSLQKEEKKSLYSPSLGLVHVENESSQYHQLEYLTMFIKKVHKFINLFDCEY